MKRLQAVPASSGFVPLPVRLAIQDRMKSFGYKHAMTGVDKSVYIGSKDVLILFIDPPSSPHPKKWAAHMSWMRYCRDTHDPFLMKVSAVEEGYVEVNGLPPVRIIQARAEKLREGYSSSSQALTDMIEEDVFAPYQYAHLQQSSRASNLSKARTELEFLSMLPVSPEHEDPEAQSRLFETDPVFRGFVTALWKSSKAATLDSCLDLHVENVMTRGKTPVIVDPWYVKA